MTVSAQAEQENQSAIEIRVLGGLSVTRGGQQIDLPPSRKTRALLAWLAVNERPQRRERLCEIFWDIPDDPRAALRWSLSRIRQIVGDALDADRETVAIRRDRIALDYRRVSEAMSSGFSMMSITELEEIAALFLGPFLDDLSLPRCPEFEAWRVAVANEAELAELTLRRMIVDRLHDDPARALMHAHALKVLNPGDEKLAAEIGALTEASKRRALGLTPHPQMNDGEQNKQHVKYQSPQKIRYCTSADGVRIAYAVSGRGQPILKCANWMSHLQYEWESTIWRHWVAGLSEANLLIRYDQRGNGLSDWDIEDISFEAQLLDLDVVVEAACPERFALLGISRGCSASIAYAVRHPERVTHLILYGGRAAGWRASGDPAEIERRSAMATLIRSGWGQDNPAFRQMFTSLFVPGATAEQMNWFNELQRRTISPENAARYQEAIADLDVSDLLGRINVPTLVLHTTGDALVPFKFGRSLAIEIPGAEFVALESSNHILLEDEPAFTQLLQRIRQFVGNDTNEPD
jgi:pimeloyl-ACP methyl ester carboxylesterase/DNA-binding SARP family transcriptional activator